MARFRINGQQVVVLAILAIVGMSLLIPAFSGVFVKCSLTSQVSNLRQLHLVTFQMAMDGVAQGNKALGWPGDLRGGPEPVRTVSDFLRRIVKNEYLKAEEVRRFTMWDGFDGWNARRPDARDCAMKIYRVTEKDGPQSILMASRNFTYGVPLDPKRKPYGNKGAVIVCKGGEAFAVRKERAEKPAEYALLPGRGNEDDRPLETAEDALEQR